VIGAWVVYTVGTLKGVLSDRSVGSINSGYMKGCIKGKQCG